MTLRARSVKRSYMAGLFACGVNGGMASSGRGPLTLMCRPSQLLQPTAPRSYRKYSGGHLQRQGLSKISVFQRSKQTISIGCGILPPKIQASKASENRAGGYGDRADGACLGVVRLRLCAAG